MYEETWLSPSVVVLACAGILAPLGCSRAGFGIVVVFSIFFRYGVIDIRVLDLVVMKRGITFHTFSYIICARNDVIY